MLAVSPAMVAVLALALLVAAAGAQRPVKTICSHPVDLQIDCQMRFAVLEWYNRTYPNIQWEYKIIGVPEDNPTGRTRVQALLYEGADCDGYLGPGTSSAAVGISGVMNIPWIDYSATSVELASKEYFPYFSRVIPSDSVGSLLLVRGLRRFSWLSVNMLWSQSTYGQSFQQGISTWLSADGVGGRVVVTRSLSTGSISTSVIDEAIDSFLASPTRVLVVAMDPVERVWPPFRNRLISRGLLDAFIVVFSEAFCSGDTTEMSRFSGSFCATYAVDDADKASFMGAFRARNHTAEEAQLNALGWPYSDWLDWIDNYDQIYSTYGVDAAHTMMHLLNRTASEGLTKSQISEATALLRSLTTNGFTGTVRMDANGDRATVPDAALYNCQNGSFAAVGLIKGGANYTDTSSTVFVLGHPYSLDQVPSQEWPVAPRVTLSSKILGGIIGGCLGFVALVFGLHQFTKTNLFRRLMKSGLVIFLPQIAALLGAAGLRCYTAIAFANEESVPAALRALYTAVNCLSVSANLWEMAELSFWFVALFQSDDDLSDAETKRWDMRITVVHLVSLGMDDFPLLALSFATLVKQGDVTIIVLLSLCVSCFNAGTKFDTVKVKLIQFFTKVPPPTRRFGSLRSAVRHIVMIRRLGKSFQFKAGSALSVTKSSSGAELLLYRKHVRTENPERDRFLKKKTKELRLKLMDMGILPEEFFAFVRPGLDTVFCNDTKSNVPASPQITVGAQPTNGLRKGSGAATACPSSIKDNGMTTASLPANSSSKYTPLETSHLSTTPAAYALQMQGSQMYVTEVPHVVDLDSDTVSSTSAIE